MPLCNSRSDRGRNINSDGTKITFHEIPCEETKFDHPISDENQGNRKKKIFRVIGELFFWPSVVNLFMFFFSSFPSKEGKQA